MTPGNVDVYSQCRTALAAHYQGDALGALQLMGDLFEACVEIEQPSEWRVIWDSFAHVLGGIAGQEFAARVRRVATTAGDVDLLLDVAQRLTEQTLTAPAATLLTHALQLAPQRSDVLENLIHALAEVGRHSDAIAAWSKARSSGPPPDSLALQLARSAAHAGDFGVLRQALAVVESTGRPHDEVDFLRGVLARSSALQSGALDLSEARAWHFRYTGSILLQKSASDTAANARRATAAESAATYKFGIVGVREVLSAWEWSPDRIVALGGRSSQVLARATASMLDLPLVEWRSDAVDVSGLLVAHSVDDLSSEVLHQLETPHPGQMLWLHEIALTCTPQLVPDVVTQICERSDPRWSRLAAATGGQSLLEWGGSGDDECLELAESIVRAPLAPERLGDVDRLRQVAACASRVQPPYGSGALQPLPQRRKLQTVPPPDWGGRPE